MKYSYLYVLNNNYMPETNKGLELAQKMGDYVNSFSDRGKAAQFIEGFCRQHPTLQQSSFRMILALIEHMASNEYHVDGRNEASKKIAKKLLSGFKDKTFKELLNDGIPSESAKKASESEDFLPSRYLPYI
jgi:hypothetical protein